MRLRCLLILGVTSDVARTVFSFTCTKEVDLPLDIIHSTSVPINPNNNINTTKTMSTKNVENKLQTRKVLKTFVGSIWEKDKETISLINSSLSILHPKIVISAESLDSSNHQDFKTTRIKLRVWLQKRQLQ